MSKPLVRNSLIVLFGVFIVAGLWLIGTAQSSAARAVTDPTLAPTETAVPLASLTPLPTFAPPALPTVDWNDVSIFKRAMKRGFEDEVNDWVNGNRYLIIAALSLENDAVIRGAERVRYTNHTAGPLHEIVYRLYENTPALGEHTDVFSVTVNGADAQPVLSGFDSVMTVPLVQPLAVGQSVEMTVAFDTVLTRNFSGSYGRSAYEHNVVSGTAWYPTLSVYDAGVGWWKSLPPPIGDPGYTETGLYDVRLTLPADLTVVQSGKEIETTQNADGTVTHRNVTGPMRDHAFAASSRYHIVSQDVDGTKVSVVSYKDPSDPRLDGTSNALKYATFSISTYNHIYGEYPYAEYNVVENPTTAGGVEFPGLVQINEHSWVQNDPFLEVVIAHETGHQWFYSMVGDDQVEHPWLDEAFASYTEIVYQRAAYPTGPRAEDYVTNFQRRYARYTGSGLPDLPLDLPVSSYTGYAYSSIVYTKGPLFLVELERQFGRDTVYKMLNATFHHFKYGVGTSQGYEKAFEGVAGKDLSKLFDKWVGTPLQDAAPLPPVQPSVLVM